MTPCLFNTARAQTGESPDGDLHGTGSQYIILSIWLLRRMRSLCRQYNSYSCSTIDSWSAETGTELHCSTGNNSFMSATQSTKKMKAFWKLADVCISSDPLNWELRWWFIFNFWMLYFWALRVYWYESWKFEKRLYLTLQSRYYSKKSLLGCETSLCKGK